jgi:hypothetical protein
MILILELVFINAFANEVFPFLPPILWKRQTIERDVWPLFNPSLK